MELQRRPREDGARTDQQPQKRRGRKTPGGSSLDGGLIDELRRFKRVEVMDWRPCPFASSVAAPERSRTFADCDGTQGRGSSGALELVPRTTGRSWLRFLRPAVDWTERLPHRKRLVGEEELSLIF